MIEVKNYPKAYAEVEEILKHLNEEDLNKISKDFINMIHKRKDKNYIYKIDSNNGFEKQDILKETKLILAYIYINYLGTEDKKEIIKQKFRQDIINIEKLKKERWSNNVFEKKVNDKSEERVNETN